MRKFFIFLNSALLFLLLPLDSYTQSALNDTDDDKESSYIQSREDPTLRENYKRIVLGDVIEQGLRLNLDQNIRKIREEILEIDWKNTNESFWFPTLSLNLTHNPERITTVYSGSLPGATPPNAMGSLSLGFKEYTIFNWGKDYLLYLNGQTHYKRDKEVLSEKRRELKHDLIIQYFKIVIYKNIEKVKRTQLQHASYLYRLNREKLAVGKTSRQDFYMARSEYLRAQNEFQEAKMQNKNADEELAYLLKDSEGTRYVINEELKYEKIKISLNEAIRISEKTNPSIKDGQALLERAKRLHDLALRENLPLPKFSIDLGAYEHRYGSGITGTRLRTQAGSSIEIVASINASWTLVGDGGLLNNRKTVKATLENHLAQAELSRSQLKVQSILRTLYQNILYYQNQIKIYEARVPNLQKTFDTIMENYLKGKTHFNDLRDALIELSDTQSKFEFTKWLHLESKIELAKNIGIEDFPGENLERLATRPL